MKKALKIAVGFFAVWGVISFGLFLLIVANYLKEEFEDWRYGSNVEFAATMSVSAPQARSSTVAQHAIEQVEIFSLSRSDFSDLTLNEYGEPFFRRSFKLEPVTYLGKKVSNLQFSPLRDKIGFYYESSSRGIAEDKTLVVLNVGTKRFVNVYRGDYHAGIWKWDDNATVLVMQPCGTHCLVASRRDADAVKELAFYDVYGIIDVAAGFPNTGPTSTNFETGKPRLISARASPNGFYRGELYLYGARSAIAEDFYELHLVRSDNGLSQIVYQGDFRTVGWTWVSDRQIKVILNCGEKCQAYKMIKIKLI